MNDRFPDSHFLAGVVLTPYVEFVDRLPGGVIAHRDYPQDAKCPILLVHAGQAGTVQPAAQVV